VKIKNLFLVLGLALALALIGTPALAAYSWIASSDDFYDTVPEPDVLVTTIAWDEELLENEYIEGTTYTTVTVVHWRVTAGAAIYQGFSLRGVTPRSKKDPATLNTDVLDGDGWDASNAGATGGGDITLTVNFSALHDANAEMKIGCAHFTLDLMVDTTSGDGDNPDTLAHFGINLHVEDPA